MPRTLTTSHLVHRTSIAVASILCLGAVGLGGYNLASADIEEGDRPVFVPITPCRLLDTRAAATVGVRDTPLGAMETETVLAHGENGRCTGDSEIPTDAVGLSMNVVAALPTERTFLTFWGEGPNPGTANLNPEPGQAPTPNAVNTPLSPSGEFFLFNNAGDVEVIIDVNGYYANHNHDDRYTTQADVNNVVEEALPFLATGRVIDDETSEPSLPEANFSGPEGAFASVDSLSGDGAYRVTIRGLTEQVNGVVQITANVDPTPGVGTLATACSVATVTATPTRFTFDVGCFGEDDTDEMGGTTGPATGDIVAEDVSFQFAIIG